MEDKKLKNLKLIVLTIAAITFFLSTHSLAAISAVERAALIALYNSTDGDNWTINSGWKGNNPEPDGFSEIGSENTWHGVFASGFVYTLFLDGNGLAGPIPPEFGNLTNLQYVYLYSNQISGAIPPELGALTNLRDFYLDDNQLSGAIPPELGNLSNIQFLSLPDNQLTGAIPPELGNLSTLQYLFLAGNQLSGSIPKELGALSQMHYLSLHGNQLSGSIPPELGNLSSLIDFYLENNQLSGGIPSELGNLPRLVYLHLNGNQLSGAIPPELGNLHGLQRVYLNNNYLVGPAPTSITNLVNLVNGVSSFCDNYLHTDDAAVRDFLNRKQSGGDWEYCQYVTPPTVTTTALTSTTPNSASSGGDVTSDGGDPVTARGVCWSESVNPTTSDSCTTDGAGLGNFISSITGLTHCETYYVSAYAINNIGTAYGENITFKAHVIAPPASTGSATSETSNSATLNGMINPNCDDTSYFFEYGKTIAYGYRTTTLHAGSGGAPIQVYAIKSELDANTTYHFRLVAENSEGTSPGEDSFFTTVAIPPTVSTEPETSVTSNSAIINAVVNPNCADTKYYFDYKRIEDSVYTTVGPISIAGCYETPVFTDITGLLPNTAYHFRIRASSSFGENIGEVLIFTTVGIPPTVITDSATNIPPNSATLNGRVNPNCDDTEYYFDYKRTEYSVYTTVGPISIEGCYETSVFTEITGLLPNTAYHFRIRASNNFGENISYVLIFTTAGIPPTVITDPLTVITPTSATLNGIVNPNGDETDYYFEYGTTTNYGSTVQGSPPSPLDGCDDIYVSAYITRLLPNTTYYFRLVAPNIADVVYGQDQTFHTLPAPPDATTTPSSDVTSRAATLNGTVNPNCSGTSYYFEYGKTTSYELGHTPEQSAGSGCDPTLVAIGVSGLEPSTTYHFRLVASNGEDDVYGDDLTFETLPATLLTITYPADPIGQTTATLNGLINPNNESVTYYFEYWETTNYELGSTPDQIAQPGSDDISVSADVSGLNPNATYYFRLVAKNTYVEDQGEDLTFKTPAAPPGAITEHASNVTSSAAVLNGTVDPNCSETSYYFEYGKSTGYGSVTATTSAGSDCDSKSVAKGVSGLEPNTTYHFRIVAYNSPEPTRGEDLTFKTLPAPPVVIAASATSIGQTSATLNGRVKPNDNSATYYFEFGETTSYELGATPEQIVQSGAEDISVSAEVSGLIPSTTYHFRLVADNTVETKTHGGNLTFKTLSEPPAASTIHASNVKSRAATLFGAVDPNCSETSYYFEYGKTTDYGFVTATKSAGTVCDSTSVAESVSDLEPSTTYHFRLVAKNMAGTTLGDDLTFETLSSTFVAITDHTTSIGQTSVILNGRVNPNDENAKYYFEYGEDTDYKFGRTFQSNVEAGSEDVPVNAEVFSLKPKTTYHFRLVASSILGTTFGEDLSFETLPDPPDAITTPQSNVTSRAATLNGTVNPNCSETSYYFEYGKTTGYELGSTPPQSAGSSCDSTLVAVGVSELEPSTTYHFRLVASNSAGVVYGEDLTFETLPAPPDVITDPAHFGQTSAKLNGRINPNKENTTYYFKYGETTDYELGSTPVNNAGSGDEDSRVSEEVSGLDPDTTYHFRLVAYNTAGTTLGGDRTFRTYISDKPQKAIIVAGRYSQSDDYWPISRDYAVKAYNVLRHRGFSKDNIKLLSCNIEQDEDGNNINDGSHGFSTNANLQHAIEVWARGAEDLFIYMVDHGFEGKFGMNESELLNAEELDGWLDNIQENNLPGKVVLVYEACKAGSFFGHLKPPQGKKRILVSSAAADQPAYFLDDGTISFSFFFWGRMHMGKSFVNSYFWAKESLEDAMANMQTPQLEANWNVAYDDHEDHLLANEVNLGDKIISMSDTPYIEDVSPPRVLYNTTAARIYADNVVDLSPISRVWMVIIPPDSAGGSPDTPVTDLPTVQLAPVPGSANSYEAVYANFNSPGVYKISIFAMDQEGFVSIPQKTTVTYINIPVKTDIKANNSDDPISVPEGKSVTLGVSLSPAEMAGENVDYWIVESTPEKKWNHFDLKTMSFVPGLAASYQGPLVDLDYTPIYTAADLSLGDHVFVFGVDINMNGLPDLDQMTYDAVTVSVTEGETIPVTPDIKANGSDDPITVTRGTPVSFGFRLSPDEIAVADMDYWIVEATPGGKWNHFDLETMSFVPGLNVTHQGPVGDLGHVRSFIARDLSLGDHVFYFLVDANMNGVPDLDDMVYDLVTVSVIGEQ